MKTSVYIFLIVEILDIVTTLIAMNLGYAELNPLVNKYGLSQVIVFKVLVIALVAYCVQKIDFKKKEWIFPTFASIPAIWNIINLVA